MKRTWITPGGNAPRLCLDILAQPHILIAGSTGSGKSVLINSVIYTALYNAPTQTQFILIDPKRVELVQYRDLPHTILYASEPEQIAAALGVAVEIMKCRYKRMQAARQKESTEPHIYIIIDELADLFTVQKRETSPLIARLAQLGRAARLHLIAATQRPTKDIITGQIKVNLNSRVALRCPTAQDSRNIINTGGAEQLPRYGFGYYLTPETMQPVRVQIPYTAAEDLAERVRWWITQAGSRRKFKTA
jgi:S-DNA-T family DNA segregation ATPase FtsK/SpoIIIE